MTQLSDQLLGEILAWATDSQSEERQAPTKRHVRLMVQEIRRRRDSEESAARGAAILRGLRR